MKNDTDTFLDEKRLDLEIWAGKKIGTKKRSSPVTIVSTLVGRDGITMASDSRTTNEDETIRDDTKKVFPVNLLDGFGFLIGQSGNDDLGARAIELIYQLATQTKIKDYRTCAELVEKAIADLKDEIRNQFKGTSEELQSHFEKHNFDLVIAYFFRELGTDGRLCLPRPHIFTVRFSLGSVRRHFNKHFVSIGCGSPLADFLLSGFDIANQDFSQLLATAIYTIEQVKLFDPRCGGKTQVANSERMIFKDGSCLTPVFGVDDGMVGDFTKGVEEATNEVAIYQRKSIQGIMDKVSKIMTQRVEKLKKENEGIHIGIDGSMKPIKNTESV
ncbi:MAG TPA: hypothetical protein VGI03_00505 [Verrucomicrobiae bacterium]|jgi:hypothetical protein